MAQADDERWRSFADVIVHRGAATEPVEVATRILERLPGCALVAVATKEDGCVVLARDRTPVQVSGPLDIEVVATAAYWALASLARTSADLGSASCS